MTYIWRQMTVMAKMIKYKIVKSTSKNIVSEPTAAYQPMQAMPRMMIASVFTYIKFSKISATVPFTLKDWANILHLSERTLQRYAQSNTTFEGIYVDRILHIEQLLQLGLQTFVNADTFYKWLKKDKIVLGQVVNFESLYNTQGIQDTINQVGRILHNVYS